MNIKIQFIILMQIILVSNSVFADFQYPQNGGEFRLTVVPSYSGTPQSGEFMYENTVGLPSPVLSDIVELYQTIDGLPISKVERSIKTSQDGRSVSITYKHLLIERRYDPEVPTGVWIVTDWRDESTIRFYPNFSRVCFMNGQYVMLIHDRPGDLNGTIVDTNQFPMGEDTNYWRVRGMWRDTICVGSNGFWCAINLRGTLHAGQFGGDEVAAVGQPVLAFTDLNNVVLTRDGVTIILEPKTGNMVTVSSTTLESQDLYVGSFTSSGMSHFRINTIGNATFSVWKPVNEGRILLKINSSGEIVDILAPVAFSKRIRSWSPTGAYAETLQHVMPPGAIELEDIRTSLADPNQVGIPPVCGPEPDIHQVGWLYWD